MAHNGDDMTAEKQTNIEHKPVYQSPWLRRLVGALLLILLLLSLLPIGVKYAALHLLREQGFKQAEIGDIDLNLFSGEAALTNVRLSADGQGRLTLSRLYLNLAMSALVSKRIQIESIRLNGVALDVANLESGDWSVAGFIPPPAEQAAAQQAQSEPWGIGVDVLQFNDIHVHLSMPKLKSTLTLDGLQLSQLASWLPQQASPYQMQSHIDETPLLLSGQMQPFNAAPQFQGTMELTRLPLAMAAAFAREAGVERLEGNLSLKSEFNAVLAEQPQVKTRTSVSLAGLAVQYQQYKIDTKAISWDGSLDYLTPANEADLGVRLNGGVTVQHFAVNDEQARLMLSTFESVNLSDVVLSEAQQLTIKQIAFRDLTLLRQDQNNQLLTLAGINIKDVDYDGKQSVAINDIGLNGLQAAVSIEADGGLKLIRALQTETVANEVDVKKEPPAEAAAAIPWRVKLARLHIADDSRIRFDDLSINPAFHIDIAPFSLEVTNIDTAAPTQDIGLAMNASLNKYEQMQLTAAIRPFAEKLNMSAEGKITALELPPLSPYINREMGYFIKRGQLNSDFKMTVTDNQLDAKINSRLNKFNIEEGDPARAKDFSAKLSMPLDAALDLLRDKNDNINLDVTINGDIDDPQFDVSKVINKALANATKMAVTGYLKWMLQPWGAMLMVAEMVGEAGSAVSLQPIVYVAAEAQLNAEHEEYLGKIAALLQERPGIVLNICGVASEQDRVALLADLQAATSSTDNESTSEQKQQAPPVEVKNDQLLGLADQRGKQIKERLVSMGVDAGRLFVCHPDMEGAATHPPQVKLSL